MLISIRAPVVGVALCPGLLRALLVLAIVGIALALGRLPTPPPFTLAGGGGTKALVGILRTRPERLTTRLALSEFHGGFSPHDVVREEWACAVLPVAVPEIWRGLSATWRRANWADAASLAKGASARDQQSGQPGFRPLTHGQPAWPTDRAWGATKFGSRESLRTSTRAHWVTLDGSALVSKSGSVPGSVKAPLVFTTNHPAINSLSLGNPPNPLLLAG
jgi:hypothetical protein